MPSFTGELITAQDRERITEAAYELQAAYTNEKTWYDAIHKVHEKFPKVLLWELECMWRAIDAYCDINCT